MVNLHLRTERGGGEAGVTHGAHITNTTCATTSVIVTGPDIGFDDLAANYRRVDGFSPPD